jgi:MOSC domain-containing protein YiiM
LKSDESPRVVAVSKSQNHTFTKANCPSITLLTGLGIEGDAHLGKTVKHRSRVKADPTQPNLRQVHLLHQELLDTLQTRGFRVDPGTTGENITTTGLDLLGLPRGAKLCIGADVVIKVEGLRNPCLQLNAYQEGLVNAVIERQPDGKLIRKAGIMGTVVNGGTIEPGDGIQIVLPAEPYLELLPV